MSALVGEGCGGAARATARAAAPAATAAPAPAAAEAPPAVRRSLAQRLPLPAVLEADGDDAATGDDGLDGAYARVFLRANPGPFQYVAYELSARGKTAVASHLRGMMGRKDAIIRTELVARELLRRTLDALDAVGVAEIADPPASSWITFDKDGTRRLPERAAAPVFELLWRRGGASRHVVVVDPYAQDAPIYGLFVDIVRAAVIGAVGSIGYHGPDAAGTARGYLAVDSVPSADVYVNDERLPERTPVLSWTLPPGSHRVRLERADLGLRKETTVRIEAGLTTSLELDLR